jgi:hypothetical protein
VSRDGRSPSRRRKRQRNFARAELPPQEKPRPQGPWLLTPVLGFESLLAPSHRTRSRIERRLHQCVLCSNRFSLISWYGPTAQSLGLALSSACIQTTDAGNSDPVYPGVAPLALSFASKADSGSSCRANNSGRDPCPFTLACTADDLVRHFADQCCGLASHSSDLLSGLPDGRLLGELRCELFALSFGSTRGYKGLWISDTNCLYPDRRPCMSATSLHRPDC